MTKKEILALIDREIAGQGTNVDGGGALAQVLKGIINNIPESPILEIGYVPDEGYQEQTKAQVAEILGITEQDVDDLFNGKYCAAYLKGEPTMFFSIMGSVDQIFFVNTSREDAGTVGWFFGIQLRSVDNNYDIIYI